LIIQENTVKINKKKFSRFLIAGTLLLLVFTIAACQSSAETPTAAPTEEIVPTAPVVVPDLPTALPTLVPITLEGATTTDSGLQYLELVDGVGKAPEAGDIISMHFIASLADGTELDNTYTSNKPASTIWGKNMLLPGWEEGIGLMKVGGKAKIVIPPALAFGEQGYGQIPANAQLVIEMELISSEKPPVPAEIVEADQVTSETGLKYYDITVGDGAEALDQTTVETHYTLWFVSADGIEYVDTSVKDAPISFKVGSVGTVFPGWVEGVSGMKVGGVRQLIIPSALGLGEQAYGNIPANSDLVMEIELVSVREPLTKTEVDEADFTITESGLKYYDLTPGTGDSPKAGQTVVVHYTGWLEDGTQFDSSVDRGQPFSFTLGTGGVIPGWDEGVATMKVGGKRQLVIPSNLGYGEAGSGATIPPNATLVFEVELLEIQP
jgi:peptidylprolyl isomerase